MRIAAQQYRVLVVEDSSHITSEVANILPEFVRHGERF